MKKTKFNWLIIIATISLFISCAKDGETGPQGPAGANGNANISVTKDTILTSDWQAAGANQWFKFENVPAITDMNNDVVMIDVSREFYNYWIQLPASNVFNTGDYVWFNYFNGTVSLNYTGPSVPSSKLYVKIAVMPPG